MSIKDADKKTQIVAARFTVEEKRQLRELARRRGGDLSDIIRERVLALLKPSKRSVA